MFEHKKEIQAINFQIWFLNKSLWFTMKYECIIVLLETEVRFRGKGRYNLLPLKKSQES